MSSGSIFNLLLNTSSHHYTLTQTQQLNYDIELAKQEITTKRIREYQKKFASCHGDEKYMMARRRFLANPEEYVNGEGSAQILLNKISSKYNLFVTNTYIPFAHMAYSYDRCQKSQGQIKFGSTLEFEIPNDVLFVHDMFLHIKLSGLSAVSNTDKTKYCSFIGHRLIKSINYKIKDTIIDEYTGEKYNILYSGLPEEQRRAWRENMGQETPNLAYLTPDPKKDEYREYRWYADGYQTLKYKHEDVDLFIPLQFSFNTDFRQALPVGRLEKGAMKVNIKLAEVSEICGCVDYGGGGLYKPPTFLACDLFVNKIACLPQIEKLFRTGYQFNLLRVNKNYEQLVDNANDDIRLHEIKYMLEDMHVAFRPAENLQTLDDWNNNKKLTPVDIYSPVAVVVSGTPTLSINMASYNNEAPVVNSLRVSVGTLDIFPQMPEKFYGSYYPMRRNIGGAYDNWYYFTFRFEKGYNPSGHLDISKNREIYLHYTSNKISANTQAKLIINATVLSFLYINDTIRLEYT